MSSAILRRNSSKQGLQNLLRVTAQRSIEDAEEIERERRRRAREALRKEHSITGSAGSPQDSSGPTEECLFESELKPSSSGTLEEDEGFSDWTQRLERGRRVRQEENDTREEDLEVERTMNGGSRREEISSTVLNQQHIEQGKVEEMVDYIPGRKSSEKRMLFRDKTSSLRARETPEWKEDLIRVKNRQDEESRPHIEDKIRADMVKEVRKEVKVSYTSKVFLQQDRTPITNSEDPDGEEVTSHLLKTRKTTSRVIGQGSDSREQAGASLETEQKLEKIRRSHQEKESQELEQLRQRQAEAEVELEELKKRREERRRVREEEERRKEEEEQQRLAKEEEEKRQMKEDIERRRMEAAERMKSLNMSSPDGDESFNPLSPKSPTFKREHEERLTAESTCSIMDRTESLNRSLKKSNSFKKTQPPLLLSKIDDKLEQYTHAIESSSKEPKTPKSAVVDMPSVPEPVVAKKNLFEAGEAWNQGTSKGTPSKDTDGLKVGVADLITQWVKGSPEAGHRYIQPKPCDVKAGDVLQKKNMWEIIGEATGQSGQAGKGTSSGKRYKFVVTGHGKYEKISIDDDHYSDYANGKSRDLCHNDL
ncbi:non-muscle caldesmon isoform X1 [Ictalurus punctatus]|uniref:Non-muscle caldesmon isoform X1 n=1 Tax=Ictalurus punctatus TaxID=7998 RepID=A0A2D0SE53_ICTPU|nr:non-muscle caldesmon isoform X1 [Ictalurus punctatus]